jgi:hypothetical protein
MKFIVVVMAIFAMSSVRAEELKYGDINFFIPAGNFNLSADVDYDSEQRKIGTDVRKKEGWYFNSVMTYGLTNRLNLFAGASYQYKVDVTDRASPDNARYRQDGLGNPLVGGIYRVFDQSERVLNFDLGAIGRFRMMDAEIGQSVGQSTADGNAASSRNSLEIFGRIGRKWDEANEWQLSAGAIQNFAGEFTQLRVAAADERFDDKASTDLFMRAAYQYRPVNEFMMLFTVQALEVGQREYTQRIALERTKFDSHLDWNFDFTAKYLITKNLIGSFNYGLARNPDFNGRRGSTRIEVDRRRESSMGLGVDWLF